MYSVSNPPYLMVPHGLAGTAGALWGYSSTDAHGTVSGAGYFTNGGKLGMKVGDFVLVRKSDTGAATLHAVTTVDDDVAYPHEKGATTVSAATLS